MIQNEITLGITSAGNVRSLCMTLLAVVNARYVPQRALLRLEGDPSGINDFYLSQIASWYRLAGVDLRIAICAPKGIRAARDWLLDECQTQYLWMMDDDVVPAADCLQMLCASQTSDITAALQACKTDLSNLRGYADFNNIVHTKSELKDGVSYNHRWDQWPGSPPAHAILPTYRVWSMDTGNVLLDVLRIREKGVKFSLFKDSTNCGGEDTLFAMSLYHAGYEVLFSPWAKSEHLEKPVVRFNEDAARCEAVSRSMDALGMSPDLKAKMKTALMPWVFKKP